MKWGKNFFPAVTAIVYFKKSDDSKKIVPKRLLKYNCLLQAIASYLIPRTRGENQA